MNRINSLATPCNIKEVWLAEQDQPPARSPDSRRNGSVNKIDPWPFPRDIKKVWLAELDLPPAIFNDSKEAWVRELEQTTTGFMRISHQHST